VPVRPLCHLFLRQQTWQKNINSSSSVAAAGLRMWKLKLELQQLAEKMDWADQSIAQTARKNEACQRLVAMPGVGPVTATAINRACDFQGRLPPGVIRRPVTRQQPCPVAVAGRLHFFASTAQAMRASLFASATMTTLWWVREVTCCIFPP
jgi:hypothetical protein